MNLWVVSMECAGIAEAGGVKNVTFSLCKEFSKLQKNVTLFIPIYKTTCFDLIKDFKESFVQDIEVYHCGKTEKVSFCKGICTEGDFNVVFIKHPAFYNKEGVYTYTENEHKINPAFTKGMGHVDTLFMDSLFCKSVCAFSQYVQDDFLPDVIHCQDASTALVPSFASYNQKLKNAKCVVTIHNAGPAYHHSFASIGEAAYYTGFEEDILLGAINNHKVEPFLLAANSHAFFTTVSIDYAKEITNPAFANETEGLSTIFFNRGINVKGITNGIDFELYDPTDEKISHLPYSFNPGKLKLAGKEKCKDFFLKSVINKTSFDGVNIIGSLKKDLDIQNSIFIVYHGRITSQKGISVLLKAIPHIINCFENVYFIIAGQGEISIENEISQMANAYTNKLVFINGYSKLLARLTNACGDFIVLPSYFEPCGLEDYISQIFGTLPIAHKTGGLNKIIDNKTGFLYSNNIAESLIAKMVEAITIKKFCPDTIEHMIKYSYEYIQEKYLWSKVIKNEYLPYFEEILKK